MTDVITNGADKMPEPEPFDPTKHSLRFETDQIDTWTPAPEDGLSYHEAVDRVAEAAAEDGERTDVSIEDLADWTFGPDHRGTSGPLGAIATDKPALHRLRWTGFRQLCGRIGAPPTYLAGLPAKLTMACVNHGMQFTNHGPCLVRLAGNDVRGLVSGQYVPLDDPFAFEVIERVLRAQGMLEEARVRSIGTGLTTVVRLTLPSSAVALPTQHEGDVIEVGIDLTNGEIGNRALAAVPLAWRKHDGTATRWTASVSARRLARATGGETSSAKRVSHRGDPERLEREFREAIPAILADAHSLRDKIQAAVDRVLTGLLDEFEGLTKFGLSQTEARDVVRDVMNARGVELPQDTADWPKAIEEVQDTKVFDVFAAITGIARGRSIESRLTIEEAAGKYLVARTK